MRTLLFKLSNWLPCRIISDGSRPYLERYYLFTIFNIRFYLHRFVGSDPDRGLHNHPWRWAFSIILSGYYLEQTHYGTKKIKWINGLTGDSFHRVILPENQKEVWTLFFHHAPKSKSWGFLRENGQLGIVFEKYSYGATELGKDGEWWKIAPKGLNCNSRCMSAGGDHA